MSTVKNFDVFLSHNSNDKPWVINLKESLKSRGLKVWLDSDEIRPGDRFIDALEKGIEESQCVAIVVSPEAMASGWVKEEYSRAMSLAQDKHQPLQLIPVLLRTAELPGFLANRSWVDFRDGKVFEDALDRLVWGITGEKPLGSPTNRRIDETQKSNLRDNAEAQELEQYLKSRSKLGLGYPWIELSKFTDGIHAIFAARIYIKSFEELAELRWGFNMASLLGEALDRLQLFIESQHPMDDLTTGKPLIQRALNLRYQWNPTTQKLELYILGKIRIPPSASVNPQTETMQMAQAAVYIYWQEIASVFPYEYDLIPVTTKEEFLSASGRNLFQNISHPNAVIELRRFENSYSVDSQQIYLIGSWRDSTRANEQIWRAMQGYQKPIMYSVHLQPTILYDDEKSLISNMIETLKTVDKKGDSNFTNFDIEWATKNLTEQIKSLRYPYIVQIRIAAPDGVPNFVLRAIGSSFTHHFDDREPYTPGYQVVRPSSDERAKTILTKMLLLEPDFDEENAVNPIFARVRYLFSARDSLIPFRIPFPPRGGIAGVSFPSTSK